MKKDFVFAFAAMLAMLPLRGKEARVDAQPAVDPSGTEWRSYGGRTTQDHYSSLTQINRKNVKDLKLAWTFDTEEHAGGMQTNPLIVGRILYGYTASQKVIALDASTGKLLWKFNSGLSGDQPARGLAYWTDGHSERLLAGVMNYLYALDPKSGVPIANFGENGRIDLRKGLGGDYTKQSIVLTSPGIIYKDLIIVGGRNPETPPAPPGDIRAFDVQTGALRWRFRTIPHPGEPGYETWPKDAWHSAGAANNWGGMSLDERRGIVYVPTGSAVPDFYGGARIGDDRYADTLLALDAATGKLLWHFQGVHHDIWDRDFPTAPLLCTIRRNGKAVDVVAQTTKQGFLFVLDRVTGEPVFPIEERLVPESTVPGELSSKTQPFPTLPAPFALQSMTENDLTTRSPKAHASALEQFRTFRSGGQFTPLSVGIQTVVAPGFDGGAEWGGPGVDPRSGVLYVNANNIANTGGLEANDTRVGLGQHTYQSQCALCHGANRAGALPDFPSLIGIASRLTPAEIQATVHNGKGRMPGFPGFDDRRVTALVQYLQSGKDAAGDEDAKELTHSAVAASTNHGGGTVGASLYARHCAICHGEKQEGIAPSFPSLVGVGQRLTSAQLATLVRTGKGRMPGFSQSRLPDAQFHLLLTYLGAKEILDSTGGDDAFATPYNFTGYRKFYDSEGYPASKTPWGTLNAIDLNTGRYLWKIPFGEYPELKAQGLPVTGTENYGGPIVTAGGLVFIGATVFDHKFRAFDSATGELLWETTLPVAGLATPATYTVDGKQFVVIAAGGGKDPKMPRAGYYLGFTLP